mmetsp:Transcript_13442/g.32782  ORF Transcript_13442/g.32782 Transcript_13442/m.32782 type:complete len:121 (+) Transcript_13442:236-598(+)
MRQTTVFLISLLLLENETEKKKKEEEESTTLRLQTKFIITQHDDGDFQLRHKNISNTNNTIAIIVIVIKNNHRITNETKRDISETIRHEKNDSSNYTREYRIISRHTLRYTVHTELNLRL